MQNIFSTCEHILAREGAEIDEVAAEFVAKAARALQRKSVTAAQKVFLRRLVLGPCNPPFRASCNAVRKRIALELFSQLRSLADSNADLLHVSIMRDEWVTSDEETVIDMRRIKTEARRVLATFGPHFVAVVETQAFSNLRHPAGGKVLSPHVHAVVWGAGIGSGAGARAAAWSGIWRATCPGACAVQADIITKTVPNLFRVLRYPWLLPDRCKNVYLHPSGRCQVNESEKGDRFIRYLRLLQILSLVRASQLLFAGGQGVGVRSVALAGMRGSAKPPSFTRHFSAPRDRKRLNKFWRRAMFVVGGKRFKRPVIVA